MQIVELLQMFPIPGPVGFQEGWVIDNGWEQRWEGPQKKSGEELGDDGILEETQDGTSSLL